MSRAAWRDPCAEYELPQRGQLFVSAFVRGVETLCQTKTLFHSSSSPRRLVGRLS